MSDENVRFYKVEILNELNMESTATLPVQGTLEEDLDRAVELLEENIPTYLLVRTDETSNRGTYRYLLCCYVPDRANVRGKMLYASSLTSLRTSLGSDNFSDEIFGTEIEDFTSAGYEAHLAHKNADNPLTEEEQLKKEEGVHGVFVGGGGTSVAYVHGVQFPITQDAVAALDNFAAESVNYVQLSIDVDQEEIQLNESGNQDVSNLVSLVPNNEPRYHLYRWNHTHDGTDYSTVIYCFSCPDGSEGTLAAPIKMRMLYASSKANVQSLLDERSLEVAIKLEISQPNEFSEEEFIRILHPAPVEVAKVKKPSRGGRGGRRLIRNKN
eukprot:TRINITY_DN882_c0_g1_i1.p1 TRINITY_DN882_c0_g1~~TRINITY_DN882_c0_g1_i1.p1  ORF type:complete len:326 (+),score=89.91 TRINITY_DN882_c0_g1_i1:455-1432(+)